MIIQLCSYQSPVGRMVLGSIAGRLCICDWNEERRRATIDRRIRHRLQATFEEGESPTLLQASIELDEYFKGTRKLFDIPLTFAGTDFQRRTWEELLKIPYGSTISYSEQARRLEQPHATRAVAAANAANPISIFVPCHRVVGANHTLTGYAGGLEAKRFLLELEQTNGGFQGKDTWK